MMCDKCDKLSSWIVLIVGLLYLAKDLGFGDYTMGVQWYSIVITLCGLAWVGKTWCAKCK